MLEDFIIVILGIILGTASGLLPGIGTSVSLIMSVPLLMLLEPNQLFLFYMALLSTAQFTGTIPSVFLNYPGETNSMPAVIEGEKFRRRKQSNLAIGLCAVGSVFGSLIAVVLTLLIVPYSLDWFKLFLQDNFKIVMFGFVFFAGLYAFNKQRYFLNLLLMLIGYFLAMIGADPFTGSFRYTLGISSLENGIPFYPLILAIMVAPIMVKNFSNEFTSAYVEEKLSNIKSVFFLFIRNITSSLRGAIIGFMAGLVPGLGTTLSSNASYAIESKLQKNYPAKKILSAETANNSGGFALILPFVLIGIPLTGSEIILYNYLVDAGWSPFQFGNLEKNAIFLMQGLTPWFVFVNIIALIIAWPLARTMIRFMNKLKKHISTFILSVCLLTTVYLGLDDHQLIYYLVCLIVFSSITISFKKINFTPILFSFMLGSEFEFVVARYLTIWTQ